MENKSSYLPFRIPLLFVTVVAMTFVLNACSKKIHFAQSTAVPSAEGFIKWKKDENNNYKIQINVIRLAGPERLQPPRQTYVVWMETKNNGTKKYRPAFKFIGTVIKNPEGFPEYSISF